MQQIRSEYLFVSSKRDNTLQKQLGVGPPGTQAVYFWQPLLLEKTQEAQISCIPSISCYHHMSSSFYLKWTEFTRKYQFCSNCGSPGIQIKLEQIQNFFVNSVHFR